MRAPLLLGLLVLPVLRWLVGAGPPLKTGARAHGRAGARVHRDDLGPVVVARDTG